ncbi:MAG TPA: ADP-ribosylglycohydrolase family protein [Micromonosporaceae bacterium]|nr:ADP-ribosylglycohydrolase family protein [Micromonosporaceae bacterium]
MRTVSGSLYGLAYGDALGKSTEFMLMPDIIAAYGPSGPVSLEGDPALVTDDTQMALAVAWALCEAPSLTPADVGPRLRERFLAWANSPDNNRAPGRTCMRACSLLADGRRWQEASVMSSKGCGANMRVTPVGLLPGIDVDTLAGLAQLQAGLTHGHPTGLAAAELTAYAVWALLDGATLAELPAGLRARAYDQRTVYRGDWLGDLWKYFTYDPSAEEYIARGWDECVSVLDRLETALLRPDRTADPCLYTGAGFVAEEALATALLCAIMFADEPVAGLGRAAATSGDSDSIACLAGAFLGAAHGESAWPEEWATQIEYADQLRALSQALTG